MFILKTAVLGSLALLPVLAAGCQSSISVVDNTKPVEWTYECVYFPAEQVYFMPFEQTYYWFEDGQWSEGTVLPDAFTPIWEGARVVEAQFDPPYLHHNAITAEFWAYGDPVPGSEVASLWPAGHALTQSLDAEPSSSEAGSTEADSTEELVLTIVHGENSQNSETMSAESENADESSTEPMYSSVDTTSDSDSPPE